MTTRTRIPGLVAAALLGLVGILTPAAASAAPPEVNQKACEAAGGTFDRVKGVKTCTTTTTTTQTFGPFMAFYNGGTFGVSYRATWMVAVQFEVVTTRTQKGNGDVTTQQTMTVISQQSFNRQCQGELLGAPFPATVADCAAHNLYPPF